MGAWEDGRSESTPLRCCRILAIEPIGKQYPREESSIFVDDRDPTGDHEGRDGEERLHVAALAALGLVGPIFS